MAKDNFKIVGVTISLSWISLILLAIFIKALGVLFNDFFVEHAMAILITSGLLVLLLIVIGAISLTSIMGKR